MPYPDLLPVSLSSYLVDADTSDSGEILIVASDRKRFRVHSAILSARYVNKEMI